MRRLALPSGFLVACYSAPHVALRAPAADAPFETRQVAFERLRPHREGQEPSTARLPYQRPTDAVDYLLLGDGSEVHQPDDLIAVVDERSATARAARRHRVAEQRSRIWLYAGGAVGVIGGGLIGYAIGTDEYAAGATGAGMVATGVVFAVIGGLLYFPRVRREREAAFDGYEQDLLHHLELCVAGFEVVDCTSQAGRIDSP